MNTRLVKYLSHGFLSKGEAIVSMFFPSMIELKNANKVFSEIPTAKLDKKEKPDLQLQQYTGTHKVTHQIQSYLTIQDHPAIICALVHGSIASDEIIEYSDFDGILIIDQHKINSNIELFRLREIIYESSLLMYKMDGLQHHHWTIILKEDLENFRDDKLPFVLLENSKVLYPQNTVKLFVKKDIESVDYNSGFNAISKSILNKIDSGVSEKDFYSFKNLTSELLLLPAKFVEAYQSKGILKKESFTLSARIIPEEEWKIINEISALRLSWKQEEVNFKKEILAGKFRYIPFLSSNYRTALPRRYKNYFSEQKKTEIKNLISKMKELLDQKK